MRATENANAATVNAKHRNEPALSKRNELLVNGLSANVVTYISSGSFHRDAMQKHVRKNFRFTVNFCEPSEKKM